MNKLNRYNWTLLPTKGEKGIPTVKMILEGTAGNMLLSVSIAITGLSNVLLSS